MRDRFTYSWFMYVHVAAPYKCISSCKYVASSRERQRQRRQQERESNDYKLTERGDN